MIKPQNDVKKFNEKLFLLNFLTLKIKFAIIFKLNLFAPVAELADAPDLGSGVPDVKVQVLSGAPTIRKSEPCTKRYRVRIFDLDSCIAKYFLWYSGCNII